MTDVRFTPQMLINYRVQQLGIRVEDIGVSPVVVLSWGTKLINFFAEKIAAETPPNWLYSERYPLFTGHIDGQRVSLISVPIGAPATIAVMEELIACGAQTFIGLGWAGSLQPHARIGTLLIPNACLREEGTSRHYFPEDVILSPDQGLVELLQQTTEEHGTPALQGLQWTMDAPYRETLVKIEAYRQRGVLGVDMETSAMFALGKYRGVRVANLLVVSDELWQEWNPAFGTPQLVAASQQACLIVRDFITKFSQRTN